MSSQTLSKPTNLIGRANLDDPAKTTFAYEMTIEQSNSCEGIPLSHFLNSSKVDPGWQCTSMLTGSILTRLGTIKWVIFYASYEVTSASYKRFRIPFPNLSLAPCVRLMKLFSVAKDGFKGPFKTTEGYRQNVGKLLIVTHISRWTRNRRLTIWIGRILTFRILIRLLGLSLGVCWVYS